ncbi:MAG: LPS export ABC transporter periplasmic protein LptC [Akkermansia sp.]|nr:hypothetical protein [Akkermansiaceae bacterium]MBQ3143344.1 LPS export ABC transporter periplasmic protein LptC [Akkermansia sp.]
MKHLLTVVTACLMCAAAHAQLPSDAVGPGEFPGLQLLPVGSVIKGITVPRYEAHKVTALMRAGEMTVASRTTVKLQKVNVRLLDDKGAATVAQTPGVEYNFTTKHAFTTGKVTLEDERFTAEGTKALYHSESQRGIVIGPVRTTISAAHLNKTGK